MYLKKLSASRESFHDLILEPSSINIILGSKSQDDELKTNTVNGVGKTLSMKLIDFCLGCRQDAHKEIIKLNDWSFNLLFNSNGKDYEIVRNVENDSPLYLNNRALKISDLNSFLEAEAYRNVENYKFISFRGLISRNLRIPKEGYLYWNKYKKNEKEDVALLLNAFLLGLDVSLILNKISLKEEINKIDTSRGLLENNSEIKDAMSGSDIRIEISNLKKEIDDLRNKLKNFQISQGYNDIKADIEKSNSQKNDLINQIVKYENIIKSIDDNLTLKVDIGADQVNEIYKEANIIFSSEMLKSLEEVSDFHKKLLEGRKARLVKDKKSYVAKIEKLKDQLNQLDRVVNNNMEFIKNKVSTSEYERLQGRFTELKVMLGRMQQYETAIKTMEFKKAEYKSKMASDNILAIEYTNEIDEIKQNMGKQFSDYVDYIYGERKYSGIDIENNSGDNKIRFDIKVEIQDDGSGGIGNVKIFCMDMLMWRIQNNSDVQFLYHDGSLFAETDPRQCYRMLKIADDMCKKHGKQYIINMNYDMFDSIIESANACDDSAFAEQLKSFVRLKLYDMSPKDKLLGIQIK